MTHTGADPRPVPAGHSAEIEWHSGGPGKSAFSDYRWQCACGNRYDEILNDGVNPRHYAHLAEVARSL